MSKNQSVVITGASTGIGRACAVRMAERGMHVFAGVRKDEDADSVREENENIEPVKLDVTQADQIASAVQQVQERVGGAGLQGLVNNAGIGHGGPLEAIDLEELRWQFEVNVFGPQQVTQAFLPLLRKGHGRIVNMSSIGGRIAQPFMGPYTASKFALEALSDALREELAHWDLHVSIIEPGAIKTPIWDKSVNYAETAKAKLDEEMQKRYGRAIDAVQKRLEKTGESGTSPERVADAVEHALTSPRPRTRYLVGTDAKVGAFLRWLLPDRTFYGLLRRG